MTANITKFTLAAALGLVVTGVAGPAMAQEENPILGQINGPYHGPTGFLNWPIQGPPPGHNGPNNGRWHGQLFLTSVDGQYTGHTPTTNYYGQPLAWNNPNYTPPPVFTPAQAAKYSGYQAGAGDTFGTKTGSGGAGGAGGWNGCGTCARAPLRGPTLPLPPPQIRVTVTMPHR